MSILDDAIREHLELKRAHGADDVELKRLEDEAFGPPQRPDQADPFAEAPTEFLLSPTDEAAPVPEVGDEATRSGRRPNITDLQEAPPAGFFDVEQAEAEAAPVPADAAPPAPIEDELAPAPDAPPPSPADAADAPLPPPPGEAPPASAAPSTSDAPPVAEAAIPPTADAAPAVEEASPDAPEAPAAAESPAADQSIAPDAGPNTEERHAIADQPTQMFDVQAHVDSEADVEAPPGAEQESPSDEQLVDAAQGEPQAAPPAPEDPGAAGPPTEIHQIPEQQPLDTRGPDAEVAGHPPTEEESTEYDFFNEQRLSDELDQALEAPLPPTDEHIAMPRFEDAPPPAQGAIFDFESSGTYEEDPSEEALRRADERELPSEEAPVPEPPAEELEPASEEFDPPSEEAPRAAAEPDSEEAPYFDPDTGHEDVLEDKPKFLEDPDDDELWFEQKPPKDFDLD
jgi:hypothetical protein